MKTGNQIKDIPKQVLINTNDIGAILSSISVIHEKIENIANNQHNADKDIKTMKATIVRFLNNQQSEFNN